MQENTRKTLEPVVQMLILDGNLIQGIPIVPGGDYTAQIAHKLGRPYKGWWTTRVIGGKFTAWEPSGPRVNPELYLILQVEGGATSMDVWVF